jgi:hypothetical protein
MLIAGQCRSGYLRREHGCRHPQRRFLRPSRSQADDSELPERQLSEQQLVASEPSYARAVQWPPGRELRTSQSVQSPHHAPPAASEVLLQLSAWNLLIALLAASATAICTSITVFLLAMWPMLKARSVRLPTQLLLTRARRPPSALL